MEVVSRFFYSVVMLLNISMCCAQEYPIKLVTESGGEQFITAPMIAASGYLSSQNILPEGRTTISVPESPNLPISDLSIVWPGLLYACAITDSQDEQNQEQRALLKEAHEKALRGLSFMACLRSLHLADFLRCPAWYTVATEEMARAVLVEDQRWRNTNIVWWLLNNLGYAAGLYVDPGYQCDAHLPKPVKSDVIDWLFNASSVYRCHHAAYVQQEGGPFVCLDQKLTVNNDAKSGVTLLTVKKADKESVTIECCPANNIPLLKGWQSVRWIARISNRERGLCGTYLYVEQKGTRPDFIAFINACDKTVSYALNLIDSARSGAVQQDEEAM